MLNGHQLLVSGLIIHRLCARDRCITDVTGHRSLEMLKTYSHDAEAFVGHAGAGLL